MQCHQSAAAHAVFALQKLGVNKTFSVTKVRMFYISILFLGLKVGHMHVIYMCAEGNHLFPGVD